MTTDTPATTRLELHPAARAVAAWAGAACLLVAAGVWLVVDSRGAPLAWVTVAVFGAVAAYFLLQLVVPGWFRVICDQDRCRGRVLWHRVDVPWDRVHVAHVRSVAGDPVLELHVRRDGSIRSLDTEPVGVLLPIGADVEALHAFLRRRLGAGEVPDVGTTATLRRA